MNAFPDIPAIGYRENYQIRTYEIDSEKRATIPALVKLMHEAAMQNVIQLNLSYWDLLPHEVSWVLLRKQMQIHRLPQLGEAITVITYPAGFDRFFTHRDYKIGTTEGEVLVESSSSWLLMNTSTRKMAPLLGFIKQFEDRMPAPEHCLPRPPSKLPQLEQVEFSKTFEVGWHDLDFNQHLNNTYYVQWMLETLPMQFLEGGNLHTLDINYRSECRYGTQVLAEAQQTQEGAFLHQLREKDSGKILAAARTNFKK
ncbi:MAG: hypothetical protein KDC44_15830 [Phaeodactylibacter sp.]|nr:hypothetical protein [Phaeodactylibacter sp.]